MGTSELQNDTPVELKGYVTDPKRVGYQILTNYESLYWRCLVGHEAWSLYELLRTFCHDGNNTCRPSVNLLLAVLGLKERRVLTGRIIIVNGVEYKYPGLIDVLQDHQLLVVEVAGEGPETRYVFHVNLTPGFLTEEQVSQLPSLLQKKHAELIERCQKSAQKLEAKRRQPKINPSKSKKVKSSDSPEEGGMVNYQRGYGKLPEGSGNLPHEQHPINTTHKTTTRARDSENNNSGGDAAPPPADVVVALRQIGISGKVAQRLAQRFNRERIFEKIEYLGFLQKTQPKKVTNPRGWLRRAIEEDYAPPDGYKSKTQREQEAQELARLQAENERYYEELRQQREQEKEKALAALRQTYGTTQKELDLWAKVLAEIEVSTTKANFQAWFTQTQLLSLKDGVAVIGVPNTYAQEHLEHPRSRVLLKRVLDSLVGHPMTLSFVVLQSQEGNGLPPQPRVPESNTASD